MSRVRGSQAPPLEYPSRGRGPLLESQHAGRGATSCGGFTTVAVDGGECRVFPLHCKRWKCVYCNGKKVREAELLLQAGFAPGSTWFLTLTMPAASEAEASFDQVTLAFKRFRQRVERAFGRREWATVVEAQPGRGVAHLHVLLRGSVMGKRWLRGAALASGFGPSLHLRKAQAGDAHYMVKTLGLAATVRLPAYVRRIRSSRFWAPRLPRVKTPIATQWWIANAPPDQTADFLRGLGLVVRELVCGWPSRRPPWLPIRWWPAGARAWSSRPPLPYPARATT